MIKYALACEQGHEFESWFPTGDAFEAQRKRGLVNCPFCHTTEVEKQIMAPSVSAKRRDADVSHADPTSPPDFKSAPEPRSIVALTDKDRELRAMVKAIREHVTTHAENVGADFAEEARRMHYGETEHRSIYGEAGGEEARALLEEGIDIMPLPPLPDDRN